MKTYYCIDCKKEISGDGHLRCWNCYTAWAKIPENNPMFGKQLLGKQNGNFKKGKFSTNPNKCRDCGIPISYYAIRCKSCAQQAELNSFHNKHHTKKIRKQLSLSHGGTGRPYEYCLYLMEKK